MVSWVVRLLRNIMSVFTAAASSRQMAFGVALGAMIGLVPKGNLTAAMLGVLLLTLQVNLAAGTVAAVLFSWVGAWTDPLAHSVGSTILTHPSVQSIGAYLYDLPFLPWTALNNTVVLGSLVLGLVLFYPVYWLSFMLFEKYRDRVVSRLRQGRLDVAVEKVEPATQWRLP